VTASSYQPTGAKGPQLPSYAVDGNYNTRWASEWVDSAWIQVDLRSVQSFTTVQLAWEAAYAKSYAVQTSTDGSSWTTVYSTTSGNGGFDAIPVSGSSRYVRVSATVRATTYGYSLREVGSTADLTEGASSIAGAPLRSRVGERSPRAVL
jgi:hypothetical protein